MVPRPEPPKGQAPEVLDLSSPGECGSIFGDRSEQFRMIRHDHAVLSAIQDTSYMMSLHQINYATGV